MTTGNVPHARADLPGAARRGAGDRRGPGAGRGAGVRDPRPAALVLTLLTLSAAGLLALPDPAAVRAAVPSCPSPTRAVPTDDTSSEPDDAVPTPDATPAAVPIPILPPGAAPTPDGTVTATPDATTPATGQPTATPDPDVCATAQPTSPAPTGPTPTDPVPTTPVPVEPGETLPTIPPEPGQPRVVAPPSRLIGSAVTMEGLRFAGIVELDTANGKLRTLKFAMRRAVTDDFVLRPAGAGDRALRYETEQLTVEGDVAFYATRFVGWLALAGQPVVKLTLTPDLPLPDGLPITSPVPLTFRNPEIDLAFVDCEALTARPMLRVTLTG